MNAMKIDAGTRGPGSSRSRTTLTIPVGLALSLLCFLGPPDPAWSQLGEEPQHIGYPEAMQMALERSTTLESARNQVLQAQTQLSSARSSFFPNLTMSVSGSQNYGRSFDQSEGRVLTESNQSVNGRISAGITLFDGMANLATVRQSSRLEEAAQLTEDRTRQDVFLSVISGFLDIAAARQQVSMWEETLAAQEAMERNVAVLVDAGSRPISELYQQRASVASSRSSLVEARRTREMADVAMVQILRLDPTGRYVFDPPETPEVGAYVAAENRTTFVQRAFQGRADITAMEARLAAVKQSTRIASARWWPTLNLSASYGSSYSSAIDFSFNDQLDRQMSGSLGLSLSMPLFDRGDAKRATQLADIEVREAELALENRKQEVAVEVTKALLDRDAAHESYLASQAEVEASNLALEYTFNRYDAGMATLLEVTQAQAALVAASVNLINARYNLAFQGQLLDYYLGEMAVPL